MGLLNLFKSSASKKGELISDYVILLGGNKDFQELLRCTPKPMSHRLLIDHILVCYGAATYLLFFKYSDDLDYAKQAFASMIKRQNYHLDSMDLTFKLSDVIVDEREIAYFILAGWRIQLDESTNIMGIFSVIADRQTEKYCRVVGEGIAEVKEYSDGGRMTAKLMEESKRRCGEEGFPYAELSLIYSNCILGIINAVNGE